MARGEKPRFARVFSDFVAFMEERHRASTTLTPKTPMAKEPKLMATKPTTHVSKSKPQAAKVPPKSKLQDQLDKAVPAEVPFHRDHYQDPAKEFSYIFSDEPGDGTRVCCCKHENRLTHYRRPYPFKVVKCARCDKVICMRCQTTEIMTPARSVVA
jgi:hypothetical protein